MKDWLQGIMPEHMRKPISAETYSDFVLELKNRGARQVTATPARKPLGARWDDFRGERSMDWLYLVEMSSAGSQGRKINYEHSLVYGNTQDVHARNAFGGSMLGGNLVTTLEDAWLLTTYVTAEELLRRIREEILGIETSLMDQGRVFSAEDLERLHQEAEAAHIRPLLE